MYDTTSPPHSREAIMIGDQCSLNVECVVSIYIAFHGYTGHRATLIDVSNLPDLGVNLYWVHAVTTLSSTPLPADTRNDMCLTTVSESGVSS